MQEIDNPEKKIDSPAESSPEKLRAMEDTRNQRRFDEDNLDSTVGQNTDRIERRCQYSNMVDSSAETQRRAVEESVDTHGYIRYQTA